MRTHCQTTDKQGEKSKQTSAHCYRINPTIVALRLWIFERLLYILLTSYLVVILQVSRVVSRSLDRGKTRARTSRRRAAAVVHCRSHPAVDEEAAKVRDRSQTPAPVPTRRRRWSAGSMSPPGHGPTSARG